MTKDKNKKKVKEKSNYNKDFVVEIKPDKQLISTICYCLPDFKVKELFEFLKDISKERWWIILYLFIYLKKIYDSLPDSKKDEFLELILNIDMEIIFDTFKGGKIKIMTDPKLEDIYISLKETWRGL